MSASNTELTPSTAANEIYVNNRKKIEETLGLRVYVRTGLALYEKVKDPSKRWHLDDTSIAKSSGLLTACLEALRGIRPKRRLGSRVLVACEVRGLPKRKGELGELFHTGVAILNPSDNHDYRIGRKIAFIRATEDMNPEDRELIRSVPPFDIRQSTGFRFSKD